MLEVGHRELTQVRPSHDRQRPHRCRSSCPGPGCPFLHGLRGIRRRSSSGAQRDSCPRRSESARGPGDAPVLPCHARRPVQRYRYVIDNGPIASPFQLRYSWHVPRPLDVDAMNRTAGSALLGRHDFHSFETDWPNRTSSVRTILDLDVLGPIGSSRSRSRPMVSCTIWCGRSRAR